MSLDTICNDNNNNYVDEDVHYNNADEFVDDESFNDNDYVDVLDVNDFDNNDNKHNHALAPGLFVTMEKPLSLAISMDNVNLMPM